tara:strand:- start:1010 stop:1759 length:750 start_codon:yes stop_codon:yes gene_type:complete
MKNIKHPYGNKKSFLIKFFKILIQNIIRFFVNFFCKLDKDDEIIISSATHAPWKKDREFLDFYEKIKNYTLLDYPRAFTLWQCSKSLKNQNGSILDLGCLLGGAGFLMAKVNKKNNTYLIDSFSGFKKDDGIHKKEVFFFDDIEYVRRNLKKLRLKKTKVLKGYYPNDIKIKIEKIKLCHIDVNTFKDTKAIFHSVEKKIIRGGIIIFDDFGIWGVDGIKKFIYQIEKKYHFKYLFLKNYMGQCILIKK